MQVFGNSTSNWLKMNWQWHCNVESLSSEGKYVWHFFNGIFSEINTNLKLRLPKNDLWQNSCLGPVINYFVLAGTMIKLSVTISLPVSYFYDFHYFCCRRHYFCWYSRALCAEYWLKIPVPPGTFLNRMVWQKQREVKPKLLTHCWQEQRWVWSAAREFLSGPMFTTHSHSAQSSPELQPLQLMVSLCC